MGRSDSHHGRCLQDPPRNGAAEAIEGTPRSGSPSPRCARTVHSYAGTQREHELSTLSEVLGLICLASRPLLHFNSCMQSKPTSGKSGKDSEGSSKVSATWERSTASISRPTPFPMHCTHLETSQFPFARRFVRSSTEWS